MGNTGFMNASIQCLRRINEFKDIVINYKGGAMEDPFVVSFQRLFERLEIQGDAFMPVEFFDVRKTNNLCLIMKKGTDKGISPIWKKGTKRII